MLVQIANTWYNVPEVIVNILQAQNTEIGRLLSTEQQYLSFRDQVKALRIKQRQFVMTKDHNILPDIRILESDVDKHFDYRPKRKQFQNPLFR